MRFLPSRLALVLLAACAGETPRPSGDLVDDAGTRVSLPAPAVRVVSLIPATTELLFALGVGDRLVGRTTWCDYPAAAGAVPDLGNGIGPNVEAVVGARPDLVLLYKSASNRTAAEQLRGFGIATLELATDRMEDLDRITRLLGRAVGREAAADSLVLAVATDLEAASAPSAHPPVRPSVFILAWDRPPLTLGAAAWPGIATIGTSRSGTATSSERVNP